MSAPYQPYYCEENVWHLAADPALAAAPRRVVFVSNPARQVLMFGQRAAGEVGYVVWDYHVVLLVDDAGWQVHDLDFVGGRPAPVATWLRASFPLTGRVPGHLEPTLRVIDADRFRDVFSSDRSHMRAPDGGWLAPPPPWPAPGRGTNLMRFVDVEADFEGEVMDLPTFAARFAAQSASSTR
ncbi:MAG: hypothetical protein KC583_09805 [Myxococcales bacterium]|nr:hypothetical protein [Myxococcales bacterium]